MVKSVDGMIDDIIRREGGYVNHPNDRGGPTNFGITQATLSNWLGRPATIDDVKRLKRIAAKKIYKERYFSGPGIDRMPVAIQDFMTDAAVNHGPGRAIRMLQSVLNASGFPAGPVDGLCGPATLRACDKAQDKMGPWLLSALVEQRRMFYYLIVQRDPSQEAFLAGWMNRIAEFDHDVGVA